MDTHTPHADIGGAYASHRTAKTLKLMLNQLMVFFIVWLKEHLKTGHLRHSTSLTWCVCVELTTRSDWSSWLLLNWQVGFGHEVNSTPT